MIKNVIYFAKSKCIPCSVVHQIAFSIIKYLHEAGALARMKIGTKIQKLISYLVFKKPIKIRQQYSNNDLLINIIKNVLLNVKILSE